MPRVSSDHLAARRQQILDGARACFTRFGYEGATVRRNQVLTRMAAQGHITEVEARMRWFAEQVRPAVA